jgi:hypothetical protein
VNPEYEQTLARLRSAQVAIRSAGDMHPEHYEELLANELLRSLDVSGSVAVWISSDVDGERKLEPLGQIIRRTRASQAAVTR